MRDSPSPQTGSFDQSAWAMGTADRFDRSYLLRRSSRFPFAMPMTRSELVPLRRNRRVSGSFSAISSLARTNPR